MSLEGQLLDQKSLRAVTGKTADWNEIAKDCIAFANATGGRLRLGIEDGQDVPLASQRVPTDLPDILRRKLASERSALPCEAQITLHSPRVEADAAKRERLLPALRASDRVKASVKKKSDDELLDHYQLAQGNALTNLGVPCRGRHHHRAQLTKSPVIEFIKYDQHGQKVNHLVWDDHTQSSTAAVLGGDMNRLSDNLRHIGDSWAIARERYAGAGAINQSVVLPLHRASWAIDPYEAREEHA